MPCSSSHHGSPTTVAPILSRSARPHRLLKGVRSADHDIGVKHPDPLRQLGNSRREERHRLGKRGPVHGVTCVRNATGIPPADIRPCASSSADPSFEPLSTTTISSDLHARMRRSDHSNSAVSSRVLYETVITATRPGVNGHFFPPPPPPQKKKKKKKTTPLFGYSVEQAAALPDSHYDGGTRARGNLRAWHEGSELNLAIRRTSDSEAVCVNRRPAVRRRSRGLLQRRCRTARTRHSTPVHSARSSPGR